MKRTPSPPPPPKKKKKKKKRQTLKQLHEMKTSKKIGKG